MTQGMTGHGKQQTHVSLAVPHPCTHKEPQQSWVGAPCLTWGPAGPCSRCWDLSLPTHNPGQQVCVSAETETSSPSEAPAQERRGTPASVTEPSTEPESTSTKGSPGGMEEQGGGQEKTRVPKCCVSTNQRMVTNATYAFKICAYSRCLLMTGIY